MGLTDEERIAVVKFRLERARETLTEAKGNAEMKYWRTVANRLYYACYYAVSAILVNNGIMAHTHAGVINQMGLHFVSKGIISNEQGKFYQRLFDLRQIGDYSDWITIDESDVLPLVEPSEIFINTIEKLIFNKIK